LSKGCLGVFDSGVGGLTVLRELLNVPIAYDRVLYFGDTGRVPYGSRSAETIIQYARQDVHFLLEMGAEEIIIACGTVSAAAMDDLRREFDDIPLTGMIEVSARAAARATQNGIIGVLGTQATIRNGAYQRQLQAINRDFRVISTPCPLFVPLVEYGFTGENDPITRLTCQRYLEDIRAGGADTVILGCTHYPLLAPFIAECLPGVTLINNGIEVAKALACPEESAGAPRVEYFVSDDSAAFDRNAGIFLGSSRQVRSTRIDIERY